MNDIRVMITREESAMVVKIAKRLYRKYCPAGERGCMTLDDLNHFGIVGLIEAKTNFDPRKGEWRTFAPYRICGAMMDRIRKAALIPLPQKVQERVKAVKAASEELARKGETPTPDALAGVLGWPTEKVVQALDLSTKMVLLADDRDCGEGSPALPFVPQDSRNPETAFLRGELMGIVQRCLDKLASEPRFIFITKIVEGAKLKDLAEVLRCSIETVRLRLIDAEKQMKECLERHGWAREDLSAPIMDLL